MHFVEIRRIYAPAARAALFQFIAFLIAVYLVSFLVLVWTEFRLLLGALLLPLLLAGGISTALLGCGQERRFLSYLYIALSVLWLSVFWVLGFSSLLVTVEWLPRSFSLPAEQVYFTVLMLLFVVVNLTGLRFIPH